MNRNGKFFYWTKNKKIFEGYGFLSFTRNLTNKYGKNLLDTATKTGPDAAKTTAKIVSIKQLKQQKSR